MRLVVIENSVMRATEMVRILSSFAEQLSLQVLSNVQKQEEIFEGAEALWNSVMDKLIEFINNNGGSAAGKEVISNRFNLEK
jgi:hypothetical protein